MLRKLIIFIVLVVIFCQAFIPTTYALPPFTQEDFDQILDNQNYRDPQSDQGAGICTNGIAGVTILGSSSVLTGDPLTTKFPDGVNDSLMASAIDTFIRNASPNSPWLSIPDFANRFVTETKSRDVNPMMIVVIGRQESGIGTSSVAQSNNNSFGNKGNGPRGYRYWPSFEASLFGDESFTAAVQGRLNGEHPSYVNVQTMYEYLSVHVSGQIIYRGDSTEVYDELMGVSVNSEGVELYFNNAIKWISEMTGLQISGLPTRPTGTTATVGVAGCGFGGSITDVAIKYSWYEPSKVGQIRAAQDSTTNLCSMYDGAGECGRRKKAAGAYIAEADAKPEYVQAVKTFNSRNSSDSDWAYSDCGVFVATVVRSSETDPNYQARGTTLQLDYVRAHPEMYEVVAFTDTSQAQPGDWFINDGHTYIFVGPNSATTQEVADASWGQHVPTVNRKLGIGDGYYRVRKI